MEEQVVTSLDHSLILAYICDDKSTFACSYGDKSLNLYSSQGVSTLPGLGYTDMQELRMHTLTFFLTILLPYNVSHLLLVDVLTVVVQRS